MVATGMMLYALLFVLGVIQTVTANTGFQAPLTLPSVNLDDAGDYRDTGPCKQTPPLFPRQIKLDESLERLFETSTFRNQAASALSAIIRLPTVSNDEFLPVGQDTRWEIFSDLHAELQSLFTLVFSSLNVTRINTYNLVFHWQGSNESLKPVLMTAHQDVVPVEPSTVDQWEHPPFSGFNDGTWIWGRGSCDDKSDLITQLTSIQALLELDFKPTRTFVLAYGIDEESTGTQGAKQIAQYLESTYGRDAFAALMDEGDGFGALHGGDIIFAEPSTGEKGYLDVRIEVNTPGGHSSVPPRHTAIGILASAITTLESNPHPLSLSRTSTTFQQIECEATYGPQFPPNIRTLVERARYSDIALKELGRALVGLDGARSSIYHALIATTQAVDLVQGGVKVNALPEKVNAIVNHRIAQESSVSALKERFTYTILPVAMKHNLTLHAFGSIAYNGSSEGSIALTTAWGNSLEPAPRSPTNEETDSDVRPYKLLMGTIQAALKASSAYKDKEVVVMPTLMFGNTDTARYWNLTRHIFRYGHFSEDAMYNGEHTVNEALRIDALVEKIRFQSKWILNWDEADF